MDKVSITKTISIIEGDEQILIILHDNRQENNFVECNFYLKDVLHSMGFDDEVIDAWKMLGFLPKKEIVVKTRIYSEVMKSFNNDRVDKLSCMN